MINPQVPVAWRSVLGGADVVQVVPDRMWSAGNWLIKGRDVTRLVAEFRVLSYLAAQGIPVALPVPTDDGRIWATVGDSSFVLTPELRAGPSADEDSLQFEIGAAIARLQRALAECPYEVDSWEIRPIERTFDEAWPPLETLAADLTTLVESLRKELTSLVGELPVQRIHGDCHPGNILTDRGRVTGFVDLDHLPTGPRVYDLAYYLSVGLGPSTHFLSGYQSEEPLSPAELAAIDPLMIAIQLIMAEWHLRTGQTRQTNQALATVRRLAAQRR
ncbi:phosphotransferase [Kribbella sp. NBC_01505]|uniref:phosphotransferase enzyme family protein n=1 Tax=Kribbella sp. NBC_01505 TaxID=2903580 RepID=UPI0038657CF3